MDSNTKLLRLEEVAYRLGISYTAVRELVLHSNAMKHFKVGSRGVRIRETDLENYIAKLEQGKEKAAESQEDTREVYEGRGILSKEEGK